VVIKTETRRRRINLPSSRKGKTVSQIDKKFEAVGDEDHAGSALGHAGGRRRRDYDLLAVQERRLALEEEGSWCGGRKER